MHCIDPAFGAVICNETPLTGAVNDRQACALIYRHAPRNRHSNVLGNEMAGHDAGKHASSERAAISDGGPHALGRAIGDAETAGFTRWNAAQKLLDRPLG